MTRFLACLFLPLASAATLFAATPRELIEQILSPDAILTNAPALGLSSEQEQRLRQAIAPLQREMGPAQRRMRTLNSELVDLLSAAKPDATAVMAKFAELEAAESAVKSLRLRLTLAAKAVLTPEQQQQAATLDAPGGTPTSRISPISDETGVSPGCVPAGSERTTDWMRSCTSWRARSMSVPQPNSTKTSERPTSEFDRSRSRPLTPCTALSSGCVRIDQQFRRVKAMPGLRFPRPVNPIAVKLSGLARVLRHRRDHQPSLRRGRRWPAALLGKAVRPAADTRE